MDRLACFATWPAAAAVDAGPCGGDVTWTGRTATKGLPFCDIHFDRVWDAYVAAFLANVALKRDRERYIVHLDEERRIERHQPPPAPPIELLSVLAKVAVAIATREAAKPPGLPTLPAGPFR